MPGSADKNSSDSDGSNQQQNEAVQQGDSMEVEEEPNR